MPDVLRDRLAEVGGIATTALYTAREVDQLPVRWLLRPLAAAKQKVTAHWTRSTLIAAGLAMLFAALVLVPADFTIEAPATLEPAVRQEVFAPRNGLVDEVLVEHGADVAAGTPLVKLRDPELDLDLRRVRGEMETVGRQLDAVRAAKTGREIRDSSPTELYRLSASEREFAQRLTNLELELKLLTAERESLVVRSPIDGRVLTWDIANRLAARPVERGEVLATVADLSAEWQLELDVADDRIGHVLAAQEAGDADLPVEFRLRSQDRKHTGQIQTIGTTADVDAHDANEASPTIRVIVAFDKSQLTDAAQQELRPGVSATAQIDCGRRSLGYVWLHDVWDTAIGWLRL
jgi:multidrug efflux pump subunit AcrA (membrane-fusion protein)